MIIHMTTFASYFNLIHTISVVIIHTTTFASYFNLIHIIPFVLILSLPITPFINALSHLLSNMYQEVARFSLKPK